jgi:hypothetical protein
MVLRCTITLERWDPKWDARKGVRGLMLLNSKLIDELFTTASNDAALTLLTIVVISAHIGAATG